MESLIPQTKNTMFSVENILRISPSKKPTPMPFPSNDGSPRSKSPSTPSPPPREMSIPQPIHSPNPFQSQSSLNMMMSNPFGRNPFGPFIPTSLSHLMSSSGGIFTGSHHPSGSPMSPGGPFLSGHHPHPAVISHHHPHHSSSPFANPHPNPHHQHHPHHHPGSHPHGMVTHPGMGPSMHLSSPASDPFFFNRHHLIANSRSLIKVPSLMNGDANPDGTMQVHPIFAVSPSNGITYSWVSPPKSLPRKRTVFTRTQRHELEKKFQAQKYISKSERIRFARELGLKDSQVKVWFINRRTKWRNDREKRLMVKNKSSSGTSSSSLAPSSSSSSSSSNLSLGVNCTSDGSSLHPEPKR